MCTPTPTPSSDTGNLIYWLSSKGITEDNKTNISALAAAMEMFGDFKRPGSNAYAIGKEGTFQLIAITKLLCEAATLQGDSRPVSRDEFNSAIQDLKFTIISSSHPPLFDNGPTYASVTKHATGVTSNAIISQKHKANAELQSKQILISLKEVNKSVLVHRWDSNVVTRLCNDAIANYFKNSESGPMDSLLGGISKSMAGNLTLTFKTSTDALRAKSYADAWVTSIDPAASYPQCAFTYQ